MELVAGWATYARAFGEYVEVMRRIVGTTSKPDERGNGGEGGPRRRGPRIYHAPHPLRYISPSKVCVYTLFSRLENVNPATGTVSFSSRNSPLPFSVCPPFTLADKPHRPVVSRQLAEQQTTRGIFERVLHTLPSIASHLHALRNRSVADGSRGRERDDWGGKFCSLVT